MKTKNLALFLAALLLILLAGCSAATPAPDGSASTSGTPLPNSTPLPGDPAYPGAAPVPQEQQSEYPAPQAPAPEIAVAYPAFNSVSGKLLAISPTSRFLIPDIDQVLEALLGNDTAPLDAVIAYAQAACTTADGLGGQPKCADGEAEGTLIDVLASMSGEASFIRKDPAALQSLRGNVDLLAAYQVKAGYQSEPAFPAGTYAIILQMKGQPNYIVLHVNNVGIVRVDYLAEAPNAESPDFEQFLRPFN